MPPRGAAEALSPAERERQRQIFKGRIATALKEEDDPLAVYDQFVKWIIKHYGERSTSDSGLLELLKEATSQFEGDDAYKNDLRYLKLWALYAKQMDRRNAIKIYGRVVSSNIGTTYSALYEDYANLLEDEGRRDDAEIVYKKGIKRKARPVERLKMRYAEFQKRAPSSSSSSTQAPVATVAGASSRPAPQVTASPVSSTTAFNSTAASRYALMLAPPAPGKRPEKLRFNMGLLWTYEGGEYSIQEARARSMGLLGKKWGPPPASEARTIASTSSASSLAAVNFNDDGQKSTRMRPSRKSLMGGAEPTVTINTKEALADVFGMFNSPEKTHKLALPGSKHAPLKKVEPVTPVVAPRIGFQQNQNNENAQNAKTPTAFRPFVDENAPPRTTPGAKFSIFVDPNQQKTPFTTPRPALGVKEVLPPTSMQRPESENPPLTYGKPEEKSTDPVFKVFTPAGKTVSLAPLRDVFTDDHGKPTPKPKASPKHERAKSHHDAMEEISRPTPAFTPFMDENAKTPFKVFTRPPEEEQPFRAAFTPKTPSAAFTPFTDPRPPAFTPFKDPPLAFSAPNQDENASRAKFIPKPSRLADSTPFTSDQSVHKQEDEEPQHGGEILQDDDLQMEDGRRHDETEEDEYYEEDSQAEQYEIQVPLAQEHLPDEYEEAESFQEVPLGGRFGRFNVMTPITERTFEFTTSTRGGSTPGERREDDTQRAEHKAAEAAEKLAAELREEEEDEDLHNQPLEPLRLSADNIPSPRAPEVALFEERTGTLSLLDTLTLSSKFRPPNPCNPFNSSILSALMTRIPTDPHFHDLRGEQIGMLGDLERIAKKGTTMPLVLQGHRFMILDKLGEGGFGSVFRAKDIGVKMTDADDNDEDDDEEDDVDDDEESSSLVALKVVKPRQLWEYHVLRRLHSVLSPTLRRSLVLPHALYAYADESYLVLDLCPQGMLLNIVNNSVSAGVSQAGACLDELLVVFFTIELLRLLEAMHAAGFIHGDLKIDNCLLRLEEVPGGAAAWSGTYSPTGENGWSHKGLKVIDFGRTIDTRLFPPGQQYIADWATDERDCFEIRENRSWTYQSDYFGLAGIIYCMLFGKYIQTSSLVECTNEDGDTKYKLATPFKRYWQGDLWTPLFDMLLNPTFIQERGQLPICAPLAEVRKEMENWLQNNCNRTSNTLKGLLKKVELSCYKV